MLLLPICEYRAAGAARDLAAARRKSWPYAGVRCAVAAGGKIFLIDCQIGIGAASKALRRRHDCPQQCSYLRALEIKKRMLLLLPGGGQVFLLFAGCICIGAISEAVRAGHGSSHVRAVGIRRRYFLVLQAAARFF